MDNNVHIREANATDANFIFNSWLKSYRSSRSVSHISKEIFYTEHHKVIEKLLKQCKTLILCNSEDQTQIFGYICFENIEDSVVIHYTYVKHTFRKMGISKKLLKEAGIDGDGIFAYTHGTSAGDRIAPKYKGVFHPYLALTPDYRSKGDKSE